MGTYNINPLLDTLKEKDTEEREKHNIFICGPSYGKSRLRVYAYGGVLCKLPTKAKTGEESEIELLSPDYQKHLLENPSLFASMQSLKDNEAKDAFLRKHLNDLLSSMENWSKSGTNEDKERSQQTIIARRHTDFDQYKHNGTVVCDFQSSLPEKWLPPDMKRPTFDVVTFFMDKNEPGIFTLVEYKCSEAACRDSKHGLEKHAKDMWRCMKKLSAENSAAYKKELLRRLHCMCEYGLLQNCPDELEHLRPEDTKLQAAFLFTPGPSGGGLQSREDAAALCRAYIPEAYLDEFSYCYAERPQAVDLSDMQSWKAFSNS